MDVQRRDDRFLEELGKLYSRKQMTLLQLDLFEYAYPHMGSVWDALRARLKGGRRMSESTSAALDYLRADRVPAVVLSPHVDADAVVVMAAADHVAELLPQDRGLRVWERLEPRTFEQMKELMKAVI